MHIDIFHLSPINAILILNGIYDVLCAAGILWFSDVPGFSVLAKLHIEMFAKEEHRAYPVYPQNDGIL